jgi:hypothetical protein
MVIWLIAAAVFSGLGAFVIGYLRARRLRLVAIATWGALPVISYTIAWADWLSPKSIVIVIVFA